MSRAPELLSCMSENEPKTSKPLQMKEPGSFETSVLAHPARQLHTAKGLLYQMSQLAAVTVVLTAVISHCDMQVLVLRLSFA